MRKKALLAMVLVAAAISGGAAGIYLYTSPTPQTTPSTTTSVLGAAAGWQVGYQPEGVWANYLGYLPVGYKPSPQGVNAPQFPCPAGMTPSACATFHQTCGNAVCDPNESCTTCPIDCGPSGEATCDPYTGRVGAPNNVCFLNGVG